MALEILTPLKAGFFLTMTDRLRSGSITEEHVRRITEYHGRRLVIITGSLPSTQEIYAQGGIQLSGDPALRLFSGRGEDYYGKTSGVGPIVNSHRAHSHTVEAAGAKTIGVMVGVQTHPELLQTDITDLALGTRDTAHSFVSPDGTVQTVLNKADKGDSTQIDALARQFFIMAERGDRASIATSMAQLSPDHNSIRLLLTRLHYGVVAPEISEEELKEYMLAHGAGIAGSIDWLVAVKMGVIQPFNRATFVHQQLTIGADSPEVAPQDLWRWMRTSPQEREPLQVVDEVRGELPFCPGDPANRQQLLLLSRGILTQ